MSFLSMNLFQKNQIRRVIFFIFLLVVIKKFASDPPPSSPERLQVHDPHGKLKTPTIITESSHLEAFFKESLTTLSRNKAQLSIHPPRALLIREKVGLKWNMFPERYWETQVLPKLSKQITVLDVGANEGQFAIPMAERGHYVISLEPKESTCASLKESLRSKGLEKQVTVHCVAAGEKDGAMFFKDTDVSSSFVAVNNKEESTFEIPVKRVDNLVSATEELFLFKTDTQGFELGVLKGAHTILSGDSVFFLMVEFSYGLLKSAGTEPVAVLNYIYDLGFVCTYMAYHTMEKESEASMPRYSMVEYYPERKTDSNGLLGFDSFVDSLRTVTAPGTAGVSGWTDLLCLKP